MERSKYLSRYRPIIHRLENILPLRKINLRWLWEYFTSLNILQRSCNQSKPAWRLLATPVFYLCLYIFRICWRLSGYFKNTEKVYTMSFLNPEAFSRLITQGNRLHYVGYFYNMPMTYWLPFVGLISTEPSKLN